MMHRLGFIYPAKEVTRMIEGIQATRCGEAVLNERLRRQRDAAFAESAQKYLDL